MMHNRTTMMAVLTTATLLAFGADRATGQQLPDQQKVAPSQTEPQVQQKQTPLEASAEADFSRISIEGSDAFLKVLRARRAIFDGRVDAAMKDVLSAAIAFGKSKADMAVFTKAEADLKPPAGKAIVPPAGQTVGAASTNNTSSGRMAVQMKTPIAWLPVDGAIVISEEFADTPAKKAALADANKNLKAGDRSGALEQLKLAGMIVNVTLGVVPLEQTISNVQDAAVLIHDGEYYQASQLLGRVQDSERFDSRTVSGLPSGK